MTFFYTPNLIVGSGWQSTLKSAFVQLKKWAFVVKDTFSFGDFDPFPITTVTPLSVHFSGMTTTALAITTSRYLKLNSLLFLAIRFSATVAAPLATVIYVTIPGTAAYTQGGSYLAVSAGTFESGIWEITQGSNQIRLYRYNVVTNWAAGGVQIDLNCFIEVI